MGSIAVSLRWHIEMFVSAFRDVERPAKKLAGVRLLEVTPCKTIQSLHRLKDLERSMAQRYPSIDAIWAVFVCSIKDF